VENYLIRLLWSNPLRVGFSVFFKSCFPSPPPIESSPATITIFFFFLRSFRPIVPVLLVLRYPLSFSLQAQTPFLPIPPSPTFHSCFAARPFTFSLSFGFPLDHDLLKPLNFSPLFFFHVAFWLFSYISLLHRSPSPLCCSRDPKPSPNSG